MITASAAGFRDRDLQDRVAKPPEAFRPQTPKGGGEFTLFLYIL